MIGRRTSIVEIMIDLDSAVKISQKTSLDLFRRSRTPVPAVRNRGELRVRQFVGDHTPGGAINPQFRIVWKCQITPTTL